jgi:hypothetical protein
MNTPPPDNAILAMLLLTGIAVGLVAFVEFVTKAMR